MSNIVFDETTQKYSNLKVKNNNLQVDIVSGGGGGGGGGDASASNQTTQIGNQTTMITELTQIETEIQTTNTNQTNGNQQAKCMGIDGTGSPQQLLLESNGSLIVGGGNLKVSVDGAGNTTHILTDSAGKILVSSVGDTGVLASIQTDTNNTANTLNNGTQLSNILPQSTLNSGITNDPANSIAVGLRGRTTINDATTETFLKCDANGVQDVATIGIDGGGVLRQLAVDTSGHLEVVNALGNGLGTEVNQNTQITNQGTMITSLGNIDTQTSSIQSIVASNSNQTNGNQITNIQGLETGTTNKKSVLTNTAGNLIVDLLNDSSTEYTDGSALPTNPVGGVIIGKNDSGNGEVINSTNNALNFSLREDGLTTAGISVSVPTGGLYTSSSINVKKVPRGIVYASYADSSAVILWEWSMDNSHFTNDTNGFISSGLSTALMKDTIDPTINYQEIVMPFNYIRFKITNSTGSSQALVSNIYSKTGAGY